MEDKVKHVVVDSGAFIKNAPLREIGENIYTIEEVVKEIRDKATRQRLQVLPYELKFRQPHPEAIRVVTDFSKKTGDYRSLSAVDLKVLGLVYQLEKEHIGIEHLKSEPNRVTWTSTTKPLEKATEIAGFYLGNKSHPEVKESSESIECQEKGVNEAVSRFEDIEISNKDNIDHKQEDDTLPNESQSSENDVSTNKALSNETDDKTLSDQNVEIRTCIKDGGILPSSLLVDDDSVSEDDDDDDDDIDEDEGWITPSNIEDVKRSMGGDPNSQRATVTVACLTTDFAMQNVLIQMGLNVVSVDGMLIKRVKNYVLRCHACFKVTTNMTKVFCGHCGNKTLQKVSVIVEEDGSVRYCLSRKRPVSTRGLRYSLPAPKGGKHARNPILCEDQRVPQERTSKSSRIQYDALDPDFVAYNSPFAPADLYSRSALLGIKKKQNRKSKNPNENRKVYGRRK